MYDLRTVETLEMLETRICEQIEVQFSKFSHRKVVILVDFNKFDVRLLQASLSLTDIVDKPILKKYLGSYAGIGKSQVIFRLFKDR